MTRDEITSLAQGHYDAIGALLEAAIRDQTQSQKSRASLEGAAAELNRAASSLPSAINKKLESSLEKTAIDAGDRIVARFEDANLDADRASKAYQDAVRFSFLKLAALATVLVAIAVVGIVITTRLLTPSTSELMALREEKVQLEQQIEWLTRKGGKLDLVKCLTPEGRHAFCGKIDPQNLTLPSGHYLLMNRK